MTKDRLTFLRTLCSHATPGPWKSDREEGCIKGPNNPVVTGESHTPYGVCFTCDATFIAEARTALPEALDEIERLSAYVDHQHDLMQRYGRRVEELEARVRELKAYGGHTSKCTYGNSDPSGDYCICGWTKVPLDTTACGKPIPSGALRWGGYRVGFDKQPKQPAAFQVFREEVEQLVQVYECVGEKAETLWVMLVSAIAHADVEGFRRGLMNGRDPND